MTHKPFIDLHQDFLLHLRHPEVFGVTCANQTNVDMLRRAQARIVVATAFPFVNHDEEYHLPQTLEKIEQDLKEYKDLCHKEGIFVLREQKDIDQILSKNELGFLLHVEGLNGFNGQWDMLDRWYELGLRSLGIVWNVTNSLGGGTREPDKGMTRLGAEVLEWCTKRPMVIDCAHMHPKMFQEAARHIDRPLYVSHGNCNACCPTPRNYTDEELKMIAQTDGVIGLFFSKRFISAKANPEMEDLIAHFRHVRKVIGSRHIAIGSDFGGIISGFVPSLTCVDEMGALWQALERSGFTADEIADIAVNNARRVLGQHLAG